MTKLASNAQWSLFEEAPLVAPMASDDRVKVLEQLQALLTEAIAAPIDEEEKGDEQDHA